MSRIWAVFKHCARSPKLAQPASNQFVYLSIEELMNQDRKESKKVVGALKNQDTGSLHPLQLWEEDKHEQPKENNSKPTETVSWCSFYLLFKIFGLLLLASGIAALVICSLPKEPRTITIITKSSGNGTANEVSAVKRTKCTKKIKSIQIFSG